MKNQWLRHTCMAFPFFSFTSTHGGIARNLTVSQLIRRVTCQSQEEIKKVNHWGRTRGQDRGLVSFQGIKPVGPFGQQQAEGVLHVDQEQSGRWEWCWSLSNRLDYLMSNRWVSSLEWRRWGEGQWEAVLNSWVQLRGIDDSELTLSRWFSLQPRLQHKQHIVSYQTRTKAEGVKMSSMEINQRKSSCCKII